MTIQPTLLLNTLFAWLSASIYAYVAWRLGQRVVPSAKARLAWQAFIIWWSGIAITTLTSGLMNLVGALGLTLLPLFVSITIINILFVCVALWGLVYYLIYLFTGSDRFFLPLILFYVGYYGLLVYYVMASEPSSVTAGRWEAEIEFRNPLSGPIFLIALVLLVFPQLISGLAYFSLYFRVQDATQKYRILLVSWSIIVIFGSALAASLTGLAQHDWWQIVSRFIGLAGTLTILAAYVPPRWLKQRYGILSLGEEEA